jgi:uncharacterized membrane protein YdfJ with MMPL/SSD domain
VSHLFNLRLTIALAIGILIHALIVRPVLLPAFTQVLGRAAWWPTRQGEPLEPPTVPTPPTPPLRRRDHVKV